MNEYRCLLFEGTTLCHLLSRKQMALERRAKKEMNQKLQKGVEYQSFWATFHRLQNLFVLQQLVHMAMDMRSSHQSLTFDDSSGRESSNVAKFTAYAHPIAVIFKQRSTQARGTHCISSIFELR